jgi:hypothetical protein
VSNTFYEGTKYQFWSLGVVLISIAILLESYYDHSISLHTSILQVNFQTKLYGLSDKCIDINRWHRWSQSIHLLLVRALLKPMFKWTSDKIVWTWEGIWCTWAPVLPSLLEFWIFQNLIFLCLQKLWR